MCAKNRAKVPVLVHFSYKGGEMRHKHWEIHTRGTSQNSVICDIILLVPKGGY